MSETLNLFLSAYITHLAEHSPLSFEARNEGDFIFWAALKPNVSLQRFSLYVSLQSAVLLLSHVRLFVTPWTAAGQAFLSIAHSQSLLKLMSIESVMPSSPLILCHPLLLLPSVFTSIRVFSNQLSLYIKWPKYWTFSFSISPSSEYSGLISFRMVWFDVLAVQGTPKSLLQHRNLKVTNLTIVHLLNRKRCLT